MGFKGGVKLTPPQHILVFKYPSRDRVKIDNLKCVGERRIPACWENPPKVQLKLKCKKYDNSKIVE